MTGPFLVNLSLVTRQLALGLGLVGKWVCARWLDRGEGSEEEMEGTGGRVKGTVRPP